MSDVTATCDVCGKAETWPTHTPIWRQRAGYHAFIPGPLAAGRELDALVAETVMGWRWEPTKHGGFQVWRGEDCYGWSLKESPRLCDIQPHYSTDIHAAWTVVQEMEARGCFILLGRFTAAPPGSTRETCALTWRANFSHPGEGEGWGHSAPHAICLAALAASVPPPQDTPK